MPRSRVLRPLVAALLGVVLVLAWIAAASSLSDRLGAAPGAVQALYYAVAGFGWVLPAWFLMRWATARG